MSSTATQAQSNGLQQSMAEASEARVGALSTGIDSSISNLNSILSSNGPAGRSVASAIRAKMQAERDLEADPSNPQLQQLYTQAVDGVNSAVEAFDEIKKQVEAALLEVNKALAATKFACAIPLFAQPIIDLPGENPGFTATISDGAFDAESRQQLEEQMISLILQILDSLIPIDIFQLIEIYNTILGFFNVPIPAWDLIKSMLCSMAMGLAEGNPIDGATLNAANAQSNDSFFSAIAATGGEGAGGGGTAGGGDPNVNAETIRKLPGFDKLYPSLQSDIISKYSGTSLRAAQASIDYHLRRLNLSK